MNPIRQVAKMLALMPVVALAAACGGSGVSPVSSTDMPPAVSDSDGGHATSAALPCTVSDVSLKIDDGSLAMIWVHATYLPPQPAMTTCRAPRWSADRQGLVVDPSNPYRAGFPRTEKGVVNVTAAAPTGVQRSIRIDLGPMSRFMDPGSTASCRAITGVDLSIQPSTSLLKVRFETAYAYSTPTTTPCRVAPTWTASRSGLVVANDGFHAAIGRQDGVRTIITVLAPNGVSNSLTF
jgi:hypothetical protein